MASTSERKRWEEQAAFMRDVGALHADWSPVLNSEDEQVLTRLVLAPVAPPRPAQPVIATAKPAGLGPAARLMKLHETQFAASRMRPPAPRVVDADVPRASSAKKAAARGAKKVQKRGS
jgi:hypothetical protein